MSRQVIIRTTLPPNGPSDLLRVAHYHDDDEDNFDGPPIHFNKGLVFEDYKPHCTAVAIHHQDKNMPWGLLNWYLFENRHYVYWKNTEEAESQKIVLPNKVYVIVTNEAYNSPYSPPDAQWLLEGRVKAGFFKYE